MSAYLILLALAISDLICCISLLPEGFKPKRQNYFTHMSFWMLYELYAVYIQNVFGHMSTWLILLVAISRWIVVCFPLTSKKHITLAKTAKVIIIFLLLWIILDLPYCWSYSFNKIDCSNSKSVKVYYSLDVGYLLVNQTFNYIFVFTTSVLGFWMPISVMIFCTAQLVITMRKSQQLQRSHRQCYGWPKSPKKNITETLIAIIVMFISLMISSEILEIWQFFSSMPQSEVIRLLMVISNFLHTLQFAVNFILYSIVNRHFRKTFQDLLKCTMKSASYLRRDKMQSLTSSSYLAMVRRSRVDSIKRKALIYVKLNQTGVSTSQQV